MIKYFICKTDTYQDMIACRNCSLHCQYHCTVAHQKQVSDYYNALFEYDSCCHKVHGKIPRMSKHSNLHLLKKNIECLVTTYPVYICIFRSYL